MKYKLLYTTATVFLTSFNNDGRAMAPSVPPRSVPENKLPIK